MDSMRRITSLRSRLFSVALGVALLLANQLYGTETTSKSKPFKGLNANSDFVNYAKESGNLVLSETSLGEAVFDEPAM
ncbi:MAG: hypothetical protein ACREQ2_10545 [Candidatus Binatia bacterium]